MADQRLADFTSDDHPKKEQPFVHYCITIVVCEIFNVRHHGYRGMNLKLRPEIHAPEPVGPHRGRPDHTAPGPKKPVKSRTNSHRVVRGPGGAWIPDSDFEYDFSDHSVSDQ